MVSFNKEKPIDKSIEQKNTSDATLLNFKTVKSETGIDIEEIRQELEKEHDYVFEEMINEYNGLSFYVFDKNPSHKMLIISDEYVSGIRL